MRRARRAKRLSYRKTEKQHRFRALPDCCAAGTGTQALSHQSSTSADLSTMTDFGNCSAPALKTTSFTATCSKL